MRVQYIPIGTHQMGAGTYPVYRGHPYQRGAGLGSIFKTLWRFAFPIAKSIGKTVGKQALRSAAHVATDLADGRDLGESVQQHATTGAKRLVRKGARKVQKRMQKGRGLGRPSSKGTKAVKPINRRGKKKRTVKKDVLGTYMV